MKAAIPATSYTSRVLVDGTLAMVIHFEPADREAAMKAYGAPGTPMGTAPLRIGAQQEAEAKPEKPDTPAADDRPKGGVWSQWLAIRCGEPEFQEWLAAREPEIWWGLAKKHPSETERAAELVRMLCIVKSRADIDNDPEARARFQERIRGPWAKHYGSTHA